MKDIQIGINLPDSTSLEQLDGALCKLREDGFDAVEITLSSFPMIIGGVVQERVVQYVREVLCKHDLTYTAHIGMGMDLRDTVRWERHRAVLQSSIDVCAALHMKCLNLHYEEQSRHSQKEALYRSHIDFAADYAAAKGIQINIENIETERIEPLLLLLHDLCHDNVGMTVDLGHLYLSAQYFGYDFLEAVRMCAPLVRHVHVNDNTGDFESMRITDHLMYNTLDIGCRIEHGRGDIHIPPLWGKVPLREAFALLQEQGFDGVWLLEYYNERFVPFNAEIQRAVREALV